MTNKVDLVNSAKALLTAAAEEIERNGWHQGNYFEQEWDGVGRPPTSGPSCALGAMIRAFYVLNPEAADHDSEAVFKDPVFEQADEMLTDYLVATHDTLAIGRWNDRIVSGSEEVVNTLKNLAS